MKKWIALAVLGIACCTVVAQVKIGAKRIPAAAPVTASAAHPG
jgi:hypothetical protein